MKRFLISLFLVLLLISPTVRAEGLYIGSEVGDCDCSGSINISDVMFLVRYIFDGGPKPYCAPIILEDNYGYNIYDSTAVNKKRSYVIVNKITDWTKITYMPIACLVLDNTDAVDVYQKIQYYSTDGVITKADTSLTFDFKLVNATDSDSSYFKIERE